MSKVLTGFIVLLVLAVAGTAVFLYTLDANKYRTQIADALSKQTGRVVKLNGAIKVGFSLQGVTLDIRDAAIGNPFWASRPMMAGIGRFDLGVSLLPLLQRKIVVTRLEIANADIDLETDRGGRHNWDMSPAESANTTATLDEKNSKPSGPVSVRVGKIIVTDSQITFHDKDGKISIFKAKDLSLSTGSVGTSIRFLGAYNDVPISLNVDTGAHDLLNANGSWPFKGDLTYANYRLKIEGTADMDEEQAAVSAYEVTSGKSGFHGTLVAKWSGARPSVHGTLLSAHIDPADLKMSEVKFSGKEQGGEAAPEKSKRLFSDAPLGLDALKSADADFDISVDEVTAENTSLKQITAKLKLYDGQLTLTPIKATLGSGELNGDVKLNGAAAPPQLALTLTAPGVRLEDLLNLFNAPAFLSGKGDANINLASSGASMHALAGNAVGVINITGASGSVSSSAAGSIASGLMELFAPGGSDNLNCLAARFIVKDGVAHDNGILADTSVTTVSGKGGFDLGHETIDIIMHAKSKQVNVGGLMPPLRVAGTFADPSFKIDPSETMQTVASVLSGGSLDTVVPQVEAHQGENACIYTLDHPSSATSSKSVLPGTTMGKINSSLGNLSNALKGFMGQ